MNQMLSDHLSLREVQCHCGKCSPGVIRWELVRMFEALREQCTRHAGVDCPLRVGSGLRCAAHNRAVGGQEQSYHLVGKALDLTCPSTIPLGLFHQWAEAVNPDGGVGFYRWGCHLDLGAKRRWGNATLASNPG